MVSLSTQSSVPSGNKAPVNNGVALSVVTTIFFMWGFLTCLNDILIPHLKAVFELNFAQAMLVQFTFFGAYFLMSLPAGWLVNRLGYKQGIVAGLAVAAVGALGFWPAAELRVYGAFLGALFVLATGITILQVAANPYVALLGPERSASSRLTLAQALNSLGTAIAPLLGGWLILANTVMSSDQLKALPEAEQLAYRVQEAQAVQGPYIGLGIVLFLLAIFVFLFRLPALTDASAQKDESKHSLLDALRHPHVRFGVLAIFFYVGAEVAIGSLMVNYFSLPQIGGFTEREATKYVSAYWTLAMIGRFIGSALLAKLSPRVLLSVFAAINAVLLGLTMASGGMLAVYALVAIGLFNSIMFPTIFTLGIERLGPLTGRASSLLIMAIVGGAIVPYLQGLLADSIGLHESFVLPLLCYLYIVFYGIWGSRLRGALAEVRA
ncbi:L-fucose:H+ symporter permease [Xanthomonas prunicola]|uniref:L-fucose:H+ symporter permease n=1 Tax=Xanthomonas prunicola TaxID=2053930 RepID=A0A9Q9IYN7_9XANT|nr:L-fucose:H+ symporter permease [Xanthomonas prunicola]USJ00989.1 L-fucose:H+ symporter permease [Xanthomonas prunicola]UXA49547.1 L-fucose:H+ symporter permease [Xanthomonas prunicola]UXA52753.1 L-fucose:H+ symporter permease [Xanthomonas prunicola]UXA57803.1 L-fucose:H+ symporter permease [Xanthomonas prunicola]UXA59956.1 L-fucose:H+ symporter permease [Xanthomonas prunicola]